MPLHVNKPDDVDTNDEIWIKNKTSPGIVSCRSESAREVGSFCRLLNNDVLIEFVRLVI